jgi:hypothetical protein
MWYLNLENIFISRHILHQHWYTCPIALPGRRNPQRRSLLTVVSATSAPLFQLLRHQRNVCHPVVNRFTLQILPAVNRKHFFMNILCTESFCEQKSQKRTLQFVSRFPKYGRHFDYCNPPLNMHMRVCYLGCHLSWTVLLPSDTQRKPITSITALSVPLMIYLLTLHRQ